MISESWFIRFEGSWRQRNRKRLSPGREQFLRRVSIPSGAPYFVLCTKVCEFSLPNRTPSNLVFYARPSAISGSRLIEHSATRHESVAVEIQLHELIEKYLEEGSRNAGNSSVKKKQENNQHFDANLGNSRN